MALRGPYLFDGYIRGRGRVRVFQDLDNSRYFFCLSLKSDKQYYVQRSVVTGVPRQQKGPRPPQKAATPAATHEQLNLF